MAPTTYMTRAAATEFLREQGLDPSDSSLKQMAVDGHGPPFRIIVGRAVYRRDELLEWVEASARPPLRERRKLEARTGGKRRYSRR